MTNYDDRPKASDLEKLFMHSRIEYPSDARKYFSRLNFFLKLLLCIVFLFMLYSFSVGIPLDSLSAFFFYALILLFCAFILKSLFEDYKDMIAANKMNDIEALWRMEYEPLAPKGLDRFYAESWVNHFPHLAERINPETGWVDPKRSASDKRWWEVKDDIKEMTQKSRREKLNLPKPKGNHAF